MDSKILAEQSWKTLASKSGVKDNGLQKALADYQKLGDDKYDDCLAVLTTVTRLATALRKDKQAQSSPAVAKYLADVVVASQDERAEIAKAKDVAAKAEAANLKKAQAEAKKQEQPQAGDDHAEEDEDAAGDAFGKLTNALQTLKTSKVPYFFLFCKDKPYGLVVSKKDITKSAQHKKELAKMAGGSTTPPKWGQCRRDGSKLIFDMEKPVPGMARILQKWIKDSTGLAFKVMVGTESADDEPAAGEHPAGPGSLPPLPPALVAAPEAWDKARQEIAAKINQLKAAVRKEFAQEGPDIIGEIEQNMSKLDRVLDTFDGKLSDSVAKAQAAQNEAARKQQLNAAKAIVASHINYVKAEPMITHIDSNPFGVKTNLRQTLVDTLTRMAKAVS
jgi:hypothetical protein